MLIYAQYFPPPALLARTALSPLGPAAGRPGGIPAALAGDAGIPTRAACGKQPHHMTHPVFLDEDTCAEEMSLNG